MTDASDIRAKLAQLADAEDSFAPARGGRMGRVFAQAGTSGSQTDLVLRAILTLIDETVLAARLTLSSGEDVWISLVVEGRRLRRIDDAATALDAGALVGGALEPEELEAQSACADLFKRFAEQVSGQVVVTSDTVGGSTNRGLSIGRLSDALAPGPDDGHLPPSERIVSRCGDRLLGAFVVQDGRDPIIHGDAALEPMLEGLIASLWADLPVDKSRPSLSSWLRQAGADDGMAVALAHWPKGNDPTDPTAETVMALAFATGDAAAVSREFLSIITG